MKEIKLPRGVWVYDETRQLGPRGGFGVVFAGVSEEHGQIAVKRLHVEASEAAHRELRVADELSNRDLVHVMPVLDSGQDAESGGYFVVMPKAEESLKDKLERRALSGC